jgi:Cd2+/Zn2+-exporting ATPase
MQHEHAHSSPEKHHHAHKDVDSCCHAADAATDIPVAPLAKGEHLFRIDAMDCSAEESEIRQALEPITGIKSLGFQLGARTLRINAPTDVLPLALAAIRKAGFDPKPVAAATDDDSHADNGGLPRLVAALVFAIAAETLSFFAPETLVWKLAGMALAGVAIALAGLGTYKKGLSALLRGKLNINALMTVAVTGAFVIGQWPEAAMVMALYAIAELIEARAVDRARNAIQGLVALTPDTVDMQQTDGNWAATSATAVPLQGTVRVRPGERIALDGTISKGHSAVNQASVTGESIPVEKAPGDPVFAGTINETGELEFLVTAAASDTLLARIIHAVEEAQGTRAPTQRIVDRFAAIYTPAVFVMALAVALLAPPLLGWTWMAALYKALVLLVIACPCALVISTPVTVVSGLAFAARRGILVKGGTYLEQARLLKAVALDKTGTLTEGKPQLVAWQAWDGADEATVRRLAASMAGRSDHPVSKAIAAGLTSDVASVDGFTALVGRGTEGVVDGQRLVLGKHQLIEERQQCSPALEATMTEHEALGRTVSLLANDQGVLGWFAVADTVKASSQQAVAHLQRLGVTPVMLTGDNAATARAVAAEVGITDVRGNLLPEDKLQAIQDMQKRYGPTGMSGDGINDAPALAQADIGFAMGGAGTDIAVEAADVVIMNDDLGRIAETIEISRRTHSVLWQNISLALGIKAVFLVLAVFGNASMWMAVFADMGASLLVVANGLRLLRTRSGS